MKSLGGNLESWAHREQWEGGVGITKRDLGLLITKGTADVPLHVACSLDLSLPLVVMLHADEGSRSTWKILLGILPEELIGTC